jgi:protein-S-isoprenylcysteine O-methyltransferase Ste14
MPVPWVYVLGFLIGVGFQLAVPIPPTTASVAVVVSDAGGIVFVAGAILAGWGWWIFHRVRTTTVPGEASRVLVTSGPYRFTRNPMYVGLTLGYIGEAGLLVLVWPILVLALVLVYVNWFVIPVEEAGLQAFDGYAAYRARVRRWL